jgi:hypothetical protein
VRVRSKKLEIVLAEIYLTEKAKVDSGSSDESEAGDDSAAGVARVRVGVYDVYVLHA